MGKQVHLLLGVAARVVAHHVVEAAHERRNREFATDAHAGAGEGDDGGRNGLTLIVAVGPDGQHAVQLLFASWDLGHWVPLAHV